MKGFTTLPSGWFETKVSYEYEVTLGKMIQSVPTDKSNIPCQYHKSATIQDGKLLEPAQGMYASADEIANLQIQKGDLLVCEGGDIGRSAIVDTDPETPVIFQNSAHRVRSTGNYSVKWLYYVLRFFKDSGLINVEISGTNTISHFTNEIFRSMVIPFPPVDLSNKYIDFLDCKIEKINSAIQNRQKRLEALTSYRQSLITRAVTKGLDTDVKLKESGVKWIGNIPDHWRVCRVKNLFSVVCGATPPPKPQYWNGDINWIGPADMDETGEISCGRRFITPEGYDSCGTTLVPVGSLVLSTRAPVGKVNIAKKELCTNQGCKSLVAYNSLAFNKYFYYVIQAAKEQLIQDSSGTTFLELSTSALSDELLPLPGYEEQERIATYLKEIDDKVFELKTKISDSIRLLEEYRSSLISSAVTGRLAIDVEATE